MSTTPHKASAEQWASIEQLASTCIYDLVILELRARVEALEATQHAHVDLSHLSDAEREAAMNELFAASAEVRPAPFDEAENDRRFEQAKAIINQPAPAPASSLVERVADAIADAGWDTDSYDPEARAAIRAVAAWLRDRGFTWVAQTLEKEANRD